MRLRRYCVTVLDNWTSTKVFWTLGGALRFYLKHSRANLYKWKAGRWHWMCQRVGDVYCRPEGRGEVDVG